MTRNEFNNKYETRDIEIDKDFELRIEYCFKVSNIIILENAINDYIKIMNEMPQIVKDWLLG